MNTLFPVKEIPQEIADLIVLKLDMDTIIDCCQVNNSWHNKCTELMWKKLQGEIPTGVENLLKDRKISEKTLNTTVCKVPVNSEEEFLKQLETFMADLQIGQEKRVSWVFPFDLRFDKHSLVMLLAI